MKTEVVMKRQLFDSVISQQSKTGFFCANELVMAGNKYRIKNNLPIIKLQDWLAKDSTIEFIKELENNLKQPVKNSTKGRKGTTWLHPYLFIDLALTISPKLKIEVYKWLYDELLKYRNNSGDSYKKMAGAIWKIAKRKDLFPKEIKKIARRIRHYCNVEDWQTATEDQLKLRDKIHDNISLLCDVLKDSENAVRISIKKALESM